MSTTVEQPGRSWLMRLLRMAPAPLLLICVVGGVLMVIGATLRDHKARNDSFAILSSGARATRVVRLALPPGWGSRSATRRTAAPGRDARRHWCGRVAGRADPGRAVGLALVGRPRDDGGSILNAGIATRGLQLTRGADGAFTNLNEVVGGPVRSFCSHDLRTPLLLGTRLNPLRWPALLRDWFSVSANRLDLRDQ